MPKFAFCSVAAAFAIGAVIATTPSIATAQHASSDPVTQLQNATANLWQEMQHIGGGKTPQDSINNVQQDIDDLYESTDRIEEALKAAGASEQELAALRQELQDQSILGLSDVPSEAANKALQAAAKKGLSESVGKTLGPIGWGLTFMDYGARAAIKQRNISALTKLLKQQSARRADLNKLAAKFYRDLGEALARRKHLHALNERYNETYAQLAEARQRQRPASSHAKTQRVTDATGDRDEFRKAAETEMQEAKKRMTVERADGTSVKKRAGVSRSRKTYRTKRHSRGNAKRAQKARASVRPAQTIMYRSDGSADGGC